MLERGLVLEGLRPSKPPAEEATVFAWNINMENV